MTQYEIKAYNLLKELGSCRNLIKKIDKKFIKNNKNIEEYYYSLIDQEQLLIDEIENLADFIFKKNKNK